jgi:2-keto-4-pentenoate hydratase
VTDTRIEAAAEIIADARMARRRLGPLPEACRPRDLAEAYLVQAAVHHRLAASSIGRRIGYKIGCTTKVMQDYLGLPHPCAAGLFAGVIHPIGAAISFDSFARVGVECEIAVRLGADLPASSAPFTGDTIGGAVEAYMAAIEIVDDRYVDWRTTDAATLIADDYFAAGAVLGPEIPAAQLPDAAAVIGTTTINGIEVGRGRGSDVLGHPHNALAWLANSLAARRLSLRRGEIVLTGSLVETKWLSRGDQVGIAVAGLGAAGLTVI